MEEWKEYKLEETTDFVAGFAFKSKHFGNYDDKVVKIKDIQPPIVSLESADGVDLTEYDKAKLEKYIVRKNDFVLAMTGATIGKIGRYLHEQESYINQRVLKFIPKEEFEFDFIYYNLLSSAFQGYINNHIDSDSAQPNISANTIGKYTFRVPNIAIQQKIANLLSSLDDKIEVNRRINEQLEELAQALFKSWFVDFEPFKDGEFVDSELGMIPKGWKVFELQELVHIKRGGSPRPIQNFLAETGYNWLKISDATSTSSPFIYEIKECIKEEGLSKTVFLKAGNLILSNSATPGIPKFLGIDSCIHDGWLYFPKSSLSNEFLYLFFKYKRNYLISQGNGSVFTNLKTDIVKMLQLAIPDDSIISSFDIVIKSIFENIKKNQQEIHHLTTLRDTLLPKLMSGEIDVNEVEI